MNRIQPSHLSSIWRLLRDPKAGWTPKAIALAALAYLVWPADILPDIIPFVGWIDDIVVTGIALWYLSRIAQRYQS